jgi:carboxymethylenebutenolidase
LLPLVTPFVGDYIAEMIKTTAILATLLLAQSAWGQGESDYVERMAEEHRGDRPVANPLSQAAPVVATSHESITYGAVFDSAIEGYLAYPEGSEGPLPGIIVIQEWWGLNDNIRRMADRLAGEGYMALAVDLYLGEVGSDPETASSLMQTALEHPDRLESNLAQAVEALAARNGGGRIGVIGWCFGGGWSLNTALIAPSAIAATVIYYGHLESDSERLALIESPVLGFFGADDGGIPQWRPRKQTQNNQKFRKIEQQLIPDDNLLGAEL